MWFYGAALMLLAWVIGGISLSVFAFMSSVPEGLAVLVAFLGITGITLAILD
jgi:hypothetical protein